MCVIRCCVAYREALEVDTFAWPWEDVTSEIIVARVFLGHVLHRATVWMWSGGLRKNDGLKCDGLRSNQLSRILLTTASTTATRANSRLTDRCKLLSVESTTY